LKQLFGVSQAFFSAGDVSRNYGAFGHVGKTIGLLVNGNGFCFHVDDFCFAPFAKWRSEKSF
jgi:hypothetical protein